VLVGPVYPLLAAAALLFVPATRRLQAFWLVLGFVAAAALAACAAVVAATPLGAAIGRTLGDFSAWITGTPGTPVSTAEQEAFQRANARSWAAFAPDAELHRLLETTTSGTRFTLYGFRSGSALCLRLVAAGAVSATSTRCAPVHELQTADEPALVVAADEPVGSTNAPADASGYVPDVYTATFGIASDGVRQVELVADDGTHAAAVAGNAFLYVADHPKLGTRVRSVEAVAADGSRVSLPFESSPFGMLDLPPAPGGRAQGPSRVERRLDGGSIGWVERLEPRGRPLPAELLERTATMQSHMRAGDASPLLARELQPDPGDPLRIGIVALPHRGLCWYTIEAGGIGGTCTQLAEVFADAPFTIGLEGSGPSQFSLLAGLASDDVAAMKVFLASGAVVEVALRDNAYVARVARSDFPIRVVAYDRDGKVVGLRTFASDGMTSAAPPQARTSVREVLRVTGDGGATAVLRAGDAVGGYRCWSIDISGGSSEGGCTPWPPTGGPTLQLGATRSGADVFLTGTVAPAVETVRLAFGDGRVAAVRPVAGIVVYAIPADELRDGKAFVALHGLDAAGREIAAQGIRVER
jgi:hypothetical protein